MYMDIRRKILHAFIDVIKCPLEANQSKKPTQIVKRDGQSI